jgi:hypothetical protein
MATTPSAPIGVAAAGASEQMPDCIIASSNRFYDLLPFCNSIYHAEPQKWGCILPWEFPQGGTKQVEEEFLRKYFTETEIHMQGGAHGVGAGFRFLKQAWYSIALWNFEERIPAIASWWLESKENSSVLKDPTMRDALCNEGAGPETFFESRDIQMYGRTLLGFVVKRIQDRVKAKQAPPPEEAPTTDKLRSASDSEVAPDLAKTNSVPVAPPLNEHNYRNGREFSHRKHPRAATVPTDEFATPFPGHEDYSHVRQPVRHSDHVLSVWSAGYPSHQVQSRKRGGRLSSAGGGTRGGSYNRPGQEYQHYFNPNMVPNGAPLGGPASLGAHVPGQAMNPTQAMVTYPNMVPQMPGVLTAPIYDVSGTRNPTQYTRGPNLPPGEHQGQYPIPPSMIAGGSTDGGHFAYRNDMQRLPSDMSASSGFNNISARSGDVRRSSFSSRGGGGLRGFNPLRGGKRGGRGRDSGEQASSVFEEGSFARKASHETYHKPNSNYGKRRGSAYQENTWRSGSEHPQMENTLPQRVLSGPNECFAYQEFPTPTGSNLLPAFTFPYNQAGERRTPTEYRPLPARPARQQQQQQQQQQPLPDGDVDERYIGKDATHVKELVVFNVPIHLTEEEVARDFSLTCDVQVATVHFDNKNAQSPEILVKLAFVEFPNHHVARRVLDLREVYLYDKPLSVVVPRKWLDQHPMTSMLGQQSQGLNASGGSFVPSGQFPPSSHGYPRGSAPPPQFGLAAMATNNYSRASGLPRPGFVNFPPPTPYNPSKGEPALSTVISSNATPANSEPNTPKKKKNKKKRVGTPQDRIVEDEFGAAMSSISKASSQETPSKIKYKKQEPQDWAASNDVVAAGEATSSNTAPVMKDSKPLNSDDSETTKPLQAAVETRRSSDSSQTDDLKSDATPTVSPRSQVPRYSAIRANLILDNKRPQIPATDSEPGVSRLSSPVSDKDRPGIIDRISDSDHVDESFHTASASPPTEKQSQTQTVSTSNGTPPNTARTKPSTTLSDKRLTSSQVKKIVIEEDEQVPHTDVVEDPRDDSTSAPRISSQKLDLGGPQRTPTAPLPVSVEAPTPPKEQPAKALSGGKQPRSTLQRGVSGPSSIQQTPLPIATSDTQDSTTKRAQDLTVWTKSPFAEVEKTGESSQTLTVVSAASIPPTPMTAYHTAPTTPASITTSTSKDSTENSSGQARTPAKKGPSQTESLSMFGKKQQKQKKPAKGKGTLKGKPLEPGSGSNPSSTTTNQDMSGTVSALPADTSTTTKKPALTVKTETDTNAPNSRTDDSKVGSRSVENANPEETPTAASGQESPSKSGIRNFFGLFGRVKSPSASGKETSLEDVPAEDELMDSKTPAAIPQAVFNIDHLLQQRTLDDERMHGDKSVFNNQINTDFDDAIHRDTGDLSVTGLGISALSSTDIKETPKKRRKKRKNKPAKLSQSQRENDPLAYGDADGTPSIATPSARKDATSGSYDVESDNSSDKSSTTMGRPTPPVSPVTLTPSKRRLIEQRKTEEHIVSPRAPRNKHVKKKSYSRAASSATVSSAQETQQPAPSAASETELEQQKRLLQVYGLDGSDDDGDSNGNVTLPRAYIFSNMTIEEGGTQQVILILRRVIQFSNDGRRVNIFRHLGTSSDDDSDDATPEEGDWMERRVTEDD